MQHKLGQRQQSLQLFTEVNFVLSVLVFRIRTGASLVTPINSDMLTISSLIWTVQPGLKHENPSAISLMVCEPADPGAAERSPPWWSSDGVRGPFTASWAAMMANHHTRGPFVSLFPHPTLYKQLSLSQSDIKVQWSVNIYQQIKTERGKFSALESASLRPQSVCWREKVCVKGYRASTYVSFLSDSSQTENTHAGRKTARVH